MNIERTRKDWKIALLFSIIPFILVLIKYIGVAIAYFCKSEVKDFVITLNIFIYLSLFIFFNYFMSVLYAIINAILEETKQ
jgi:hypothetical protein